MENLKRYLLEEKEEVDFLRQSFTKDFYKDSILAIGAIIELYKGAFDCLEKARNTVEVSSKDYLQSLDNADIYIEKGLQYENIASKLLKAYQESQRPTYFKRFKDRDLSLNGLLKVMKTSRYDFACEIVKGYIIDSNMFGAEDYDAFLESVLSYFTELNIDELANSLICNSFEFFSMVEFEEEFWVSCRESSSSFDEDSENIIDLKSYKEQKSNGNIIIQNF